MNHSLHFSLVLKVKFMLHFFSSFFILFSPGYCRAKCFNLLQHFRFSNWYLTLNIFLLTVDPNYHSVIIYQSKYKHSINIYLPHLNFGSVVVDHLIWCTLSQTHLTQQKDSGSQSNSSSDSSLYAQKLTD